jgi:2-oxoisovalerate dehydrogenase E2 component (dihydrolipoyl transacylase)
MEIKLNKIGGILKGMTKTMTQALSIPFFTYQDEYEATNVMNLRQELKDNYDRLTMLPFFIKAVSLALTEYPGMNVNVNPATDDDGYITEYVIKKNHNIAVAIDSPNGLVVPVIKQVQEKSIIDINSDLLELIGKAKESKLDMEDYEGGTFSVSSVGNLGGTYFVPTILRPQGSIIAIGRARKVAKYIETKADGEHVFEPASYIAFSISCDHRVIDGGTCARFSEALRKYIENPATMVVNMS